MFTKIITAKTFLLASFIIKGWRRTKNLEPPKIIYHPHHLICVQLRKMPKKQITHFLLQIIHFNVSLWYLPWTLKSLLFLVVEIWNDGWNKWWQYCAKVKLFLLALEAAHKFWLISTRSQVKLSSKTDSYWVGWRNCKRIRY